jgi:uncharacterized membrane protein HdeD (DUF308 family)
MATSAKSTPNRNKLFWGATPGEMERILAENWWVIALRGVLGIIFGFLALFMTGTTIVSLVLVFSAYMLVDGVFSIAAALRSRGRNEQWGWLLLNGTISILAAIVAFLWPLVTAVAVVLAIAVWSIVAGAFQLASAFRMAKGSRGRSWLIFSGIVSILFGAVLVLSPLIGAIVLTWWIGAYVLVWSVLLLAIAFTVKSTSSRRGAGEDSGTVAPPQTR